MTPPPLWLVSPLCSGACCSGCKAAICVQIVALAPGLPLSSAPCAFGLPGEAVPVRACAHVCVCVCVCARASARVRRSVCLCACMRVLICGCGCGC